MLSLLLLKAAVAQTQKAALQTALQTFVDGLAQKEGYAIGLAVKTADFELIVSANAAAEDTFLFGSGTKPFTAVGVMQLVEAGVVSLSDPVAMHIDPVLKDLTGNVSYTFGALFGTAAAEVTVEHVLSMQSGIADWDVPDFDRKLLINGTALHSPLEFIENAAAQPSPYEGHFVCQPGTCVCYSSTNFQLAGLILLRHYNSSSKGPNAWRTLNQKVLFNRDGVNKTDYEDIQFFTDEALTRWLTVPGKSGSLFQKKTTILSQNSSILGWTCGNMVSPVLDVARFFYALLGSKLNIVNAASLSEMTNFKPLSIGWAKGQISYGLGLMVQQTSPTMARAAKRAPQIGDEGAYVGHGGDTYGFLSEQGWYPLLNASIVAVANEDGNGAFVKNAVACGAFSLSLSLSLQVSTYLPPPSYVRLAVPLTTTTLLRFAAEKRR